VDDENLAVIASVRRIAVLRREGIERMEFDEVDAGTLEFVEERRGRIGRPVAVVDDVHLDARLAFRLQKRPEILAAIGDVLQDVVLEIDAMFRSADGAEDCGKTFGSVPQQLDPIADGQWPTGDGLFDREMASQIVTAFALLQPGEDDPALLRREE